VATLPLEVTPVDLPEEFEVRASVLGPTFFRVVGGDGLVGPVADDHETVGVETVLGCQVVGHSLRAPARQEHVGIVAAGAVGVALDADPGLPEALRDVAEAEVDDGLGVGVEGVGAGGEADRQSLGSQSRSTGARGLVQLREPGFRLGRVGRTREVDLPQSAGVDDAAPGGHVLGHSDLLVEQAGLAVDILALDAGVVAAQVEEVGVVAVGAEPNVVDGLPAEVLGHVQASGQDLDGLVLGGRVGVDLGGSLEPAFDQTGQLALVAVDPGLLGVEHVGDDVRGDLGAGEHVGAGHVLQAVLVVRGPDHGGIHPAGLEVGGRVDSRGGLDDLDVVVVQAGGLEALEQEGVARRTEGHGDLLAPEVVHAVDVTGTDDDVAAAGPIGLEDDPGIVHTQAAGLGREGIGGDPQEVVLAGLPTAAAGLEVVVDDELHGETVVGVEAAVLRRGEAVVEVLAAGVATPGDHADADGLDALLDLLGLGHLVGAAATLGGHLVEHAEVVQTEPGAAQDGQDQQELGQGLHLHGFSSRRLWVTVARTDLFDAC